MRKWDPSQIIAELLDKYPEARAVIIFQSTAPAAELKQKGFYRVWHKDETIDMDELPGTDHPSLDIVLDRLVIRDEARLSDSIEMAWREGHGRIKVAVLQGQDRPDSGTRSSLSDNFQLRTYVKSVKSVSLSLRPCFFPLITLSALVLSARGLAIPCATMKT